MTIDKLIELYQNNFNLIFKPSYIKGYSYHFYPYGIEQLGHIVSRTNDICYLLNKQIIKKQNLNYELQTITREQQTFIEVYRFEKNASSEFVVQSAVHEQMSDINTFIKKGQYYYPTLGSGVYLHCSNILYGLNKLDIITILGKQYIEKSTTNLSQFYNNNTLSKDTFTNIYNNNLIYFAIINNTMGLFDLSSSNISLYNLDFITSAKRFNYLLHNTFIGQLLNEICTKSCSDKIRDVIFKLYEGLYSGKITVYECIKLLHTLINHNIENIHKIKLLSDIIINIINELATTQSTFAHIFNWICYDNTCNESEINIHTLTIKDILYEFLPKIYHPLINHKLINKSENKVNTLIYFIIELYYDLYDANFNQICIDATLFFLAKECSYDTIVVTHEPTDKKQYIGCEIIAIDDIPKTCFERTLNARDLITATTLNDTLTSFYSNYTI